MNRKSKRIINILLVICILITSFVGSAYATRFVFSDSVGHWAEDAINNLARKGVIHGYPDGLSHPDEIITRGEFSALLARIMELEPKETNTVNIVFEDIAGHFAQKEIEALIDAGIIIKEEYSAKYFPDEPITRIEMIKMLVRAIGKEEHNMDCACNSGFTDEDDLTEEEREYICAGKHYNIISGYPDGTIRPDGEATRGEAFEILDKHDEIKEIIEQEEAADKIEEDVVDSPDVESDDKPSDNGSSSNGGSSYVPAPKYDFTLPNTSYVGEEIKIIPTSSNVKSVTWIVTKNGIPTELSSVLDGELKAEGGVIKIKSTGSYTFSATALNSRGLPITMTAATIEAVILIATTLIGNLNLVLDAAFQIISGLAQGLLNALPTLIQSLPQIINTIINFLTNNLPKIVEMGIRLTVQLAAGLIKAIPQLVSSIPQIVAAIITGLGKAVASVVEVGKNIARGLWDGIASMIGWLRDKVDNMVGGIVRGVKGVLGIRSPSKVFAGIGQNMGEGIGVGFTDAMRGVEKDMEGAIPTDFNLNMDSVVTGAEGRSNGAIFDVTIPLTIDGNVLTRVIAQLQWNQNTVTVRNLGVART